MVVPLGQVYILRHTLPRSCTEICELFVKEIWCDVRNYHPWQSEVGSVEIPRVLLQAQLSSYCIFWFVTFLKVKHIQMHKTNSNIKVQIQQWILYSSRENVFTTKIYGPPHMHLVFSPWHLLFISCVFPVGVWVQIYLPSSLLTLVCLRSSFRLLLLAFSRWRFCLSRMFKSVSISGLNGSKVDLDYLLVEFSDDFCVGSSELNFKQTTPSLFCICVDGPGLTKTEIVSKNRVTFRRCRKHRVVNFRSVFFLQYPCRWVESCPVCD